MRTLLALIIALALAGCGIPAGVAMWFQTRRYSGDGIIRSCSNLASAGYSIDFPAFDASRPFNASYRMADVPKVAGRDPQIYLKFRCEFGSSEEIIKHTTASFHLAVLDSSGKAIRSVALPLSATNWTGAEAPAFEHTMLVAANFTSSRMQAMFSKYRTIPTVFSHPRNAFISASTTVRFTNRLTGRWSQPRTSDTPRFTCS